MAQKTFIVDTNVVIRYFYSDNAQQHALVTPYFENDNYHLVIACETLCEMTWVLHKKMKIKYSVIFTIIETLRKSSNITLTNLDAVKLGLIFLENNRDFADGVIAYQTTQFPNSSLLTFDKDAQKIAKKLNIPLQVP